ncbi:ATP-binding cassette sub-family C member 2-like [Physella acuta]|uniref:ATP-binding cassette sub-family C member 2-like n=1 Tax=Physella acuta TaxID=109671 RepID=UPI0027DB6C97|nr:ATP-binding cassette sub-family C member 2-like [Physella acuta]
MMRMQSNTMELMTCWSGSSPSFLKDSKKRLNKLFSTASETGDTNRNRKYDETNAGNPSFQVFQNSFRRVWSFSVTIILVLFTLFQMFSLLADVKLAQWAGDPEIQTGNLTAPKNQLKLKRYFTEYAVLGVAEVLFVLAYASMEALRIISATYSIHASVLNKNMETSGTAKEQYKNLLTQRLEKPGDKFPQIMLMWILCVFSVLVKLTVICIFVPKFIVAIVPLLFAYLAIQRFVVPASQELNRLESASKLSIFSHFSETLNGCHVIWALNAKNRFYETCTKLIDQNNSFYYARMSANRWLGVWTEAVSSLVVCFTASLSLSTHRMDAAHLVYLLSTPYRSNII